MMNRRHFMKHAAGASALAGTSISFTQSLSAQIDTLKKNQKSAILMWMSGGPSTMDIWDLKPNAPTGGAFKPISTTGDMQICEHMPMMAKNMDKVSLVRSMSTREADHERGRYYMHTGFVPNPNVAHPSYGSVVSHQLADKDATLPPFISVGGGSIGPGFLGMSYAPLVVNSNGQVNNIQGLVEQDRLMQRMHMLRAIEGRFINENRGEPAKDHAKILDKTLALMTSEQMKAFRVMEEDPKVLERYGDNNFGRGLCLARRLVEAGVSFIEVNLGGWDMHQNIFPTLETRLPMMDQAMSALIEDLNQRGMMENVVLMWMGEFSRTPRINATAGRDHWARSWTAMVGGGKIQGGRAIGESNEDGTAVVSEPYSSEDLMASVCHAMDISLQTTFTSGNGRPMKIANGGRLIEGLF
ncbi:Secreted protein containing DUF1501 [Planctomycetales bacterium 10988]|nr:Secreted protein containing DUF1501 [Planctomycetales bacterium 10988]